MDTPKSPADKPDGHRPGLAPMPPDIYVRRVVRRIDWKRLFYIVLGLALFSVVYFWPALPDAVDALEAEKEALEVRMGAPDYYRRPQADQAADRAELERLEAELEARMERWEELENLDS